MLRVHAFSRKRRHELRNKNAFSCVSEKNSIDGRERMGIKQLAKVIADHAPQALKENEIKNYFGRKIAVDASMSIYQFLIAVRQQGQMLTNDAGALLVVLAKVLLVLSCR